jgi:hypothetical protein
MDTDTIDQPVHRLIPSNFPPINTFESCTSADDLEAVFELEGWTNDRVVLDRIKRLPRTQWIYGEPCASSIMASFLHANEGRFNDDDLGAWYASSIVKAAIAEVAHHALGEITGRGERAGVRKYREYLSTLRGDYLDLRVNPAFPELDLGDYLPGQALGRNLRDGAFESTGPHGILFPALRYGDPSAWNCVCLAPRQIKETRQARHLELTLEVGKSVRVRVLVDKV